MSAPQYITELVCEKKARKDNKDLPRKFWEIKEWRNYFRYQITLANKLLKEFSESIVIAAIKDDRCWSLYSLRSPFLRKIIQEKAAQPEAKPEGIEYNFHTSGNVVHKTNNKEQSIISKLRDLDE